MVILDSVAPVRADLRGAVLAVGNFDGVHRGHAALIGRLRALAVAVGAPAVALTFDPSPAAILRPDRAPTPLTWTGRKVELLKDAGAAEVGVFRTGRWLLDLTARAFFETVVLGRFAARGMVEGPTFGFGRDRGGDAALLGSWCDEAGLAFEIAPPLELDGALVSSTRIRRDLDGGRADEAAALLGRPHRLRGRVVRGAGRGRGLGFPTANLEAIDVQVPADGVYAARAVLDDGPPCPVALHIGPNATFDERARQVEAHLIGFSGDLYGRQIALDVLRRLRPSRKFNGVDDLRAQIRADVEQASAVAG